MIVNLAIGAALVASGIVLARDALTLALSPEGKGIPAPKKQVSLRQEREELGHYAPVLANNVFGFPAGRLRPLSASRARVRTGGGVTLRGTVASAAGEGYAIVEDSAGEQSVYSAGDYIEGTGTLKRIARDRIIVEADGKELEFELADIIGVRELPRGKRGRENLRRSVPKNNAKPGDFARKTAPQSYIVDRDAVNAALENPERMMTDARLLPVVVEGKQEGFVISEVRQGGIYHSLGLRNGDVLKRINEFTISDPQNALQAFTALRGMDRIELDIVRDGKRMTLTYTIR